MINTDELFNQMNHEFDIDHLVKLAKKLGITLNERQLKQEANARFGQCAFNAWSKSKFPNRKLNQRIKTR
ncbi:hypothetical protein [Aliivibrio fischeri]|uniref:hypothetical protein n=1 Tax=Aliivibrio fischeri TaxID=668 RepID=UPI001F1B39A6|nr:hypothetical protein [Aliivibrio fischeri]MCE4937445.1 hypothetical protein [Aliivibrio fischeri]